MQTANSHASRGINGMVKPRYDAKKDAAPWRPIRPLPILGLHLAC